MAGSVRVNLSVPERVDKALSGIAKMTGRTKAAVVMEVVGNYLPQWEADLRSNEARLRYQAQQLAKLSPQSGASGG